MSKKSKEDPMKTIKALASRLEKEYQAQYGKDVVFVASCYGFSGEREPHYYLMIQTDDKDIRQQIPTMVEGYPVSVSDIPRAY
jgi:hypothetical protein